MDSKMIKPVEIPTQSSANDVAATLPEGGMPFSDLSPGWEQPRSREVVPGKIFIGGLAWKTSEQSLRSYFETFCAVNSVDIMKCKRTGQPRGFGFVVLSDPSMLELVCSLEHIIEDRKVEVKPHMTQREIMPNVEHTTTFKLFVGGLKGEAKDTDLVAYFSHYGEVTDAMIMMDRMTNRSRGFGFVTFAKEEALDATLAQRDHFMFEKWMDVKRAMPRVKRLTTNDNTHIRDQHYLGYGNQQPRQQQMLQHHHRGPPHMHVGHFFQVGDTGQGYGGQSVQMPMGMDGEGHKGDVVGPRDYTQQHARMQGMPTGGDPRRMPPYSSQVPAQRVAYTDGFDHGMMQQQHGLHHPHSPSGLPGNGIDMITAFHSANAQQAFMSSNAQQRQQRQQQQQQQQQQHHHHHHHHQQQQQRLMQMQQHQQQMQQMQQQDRNTMRRGGP